MYIPPIFQDNHKNSQLFNNSLVSLVQTHLNIHLDSLSSSIIQSICIIPNNNSISIFTFSSLNHPRYPTIISITHLLLISHSISIISKTFSTNHFYQTNISINSFSPYVEFFIICVLVRKFL